VQAVVFPSGVEKTLGDSSNICMQCHQGRESGLSVVNNTTWPRGFINLHYFAEAAMFFGTEVTAGYEYADRNYNGQNQFAGHEQIKKQNCIQCHLERRLIDGTVKKDHTFFPETGGDNTVQATCNGCHYNLTDFDDLGKPFGNRNVDYDGDGIGESFRHEVDGMQARLILQMNVYAKANGYSPIMYTPKVYPYFAKATCYQQDPGCQPAPAGNYSFPNAQFLGAAYNYHLAQDPGAGIHNHKYVIQLLYDAIENLGGVGAVAGLTRPAYVPPQT